jgi:hypothetical protein
VPRATADGLTLLHDREPHFIIEDGPDTTGQGLPGPRGGDTSGDGAVASENRSTRRRSHHTYELAKPKHGLSQATKRRLINAAGATACTLLFPVIAPLMLTYRFFTERRFRNTTLKVVTIPLWGPPKLFVKLVRDNPF